MSDVDSREGEFAFSHNILKLFYTNNFSKKIKTYNLLAHIITLEIRIYPKYG